MIAITATTGMPALSMKGFEVGLLNAELLAAFSSPIDVPPLERPNQLQKSLEKVLSLHCFLPKDQ